MKLETAFEIIQEQHDYLLTLPSYAGRKPIDVKTNKDGGKIKSYRIKNGIDPTKVFVEHVETIGGEDEGSYFAEIYKIDHPTKGSGYIEYTGSYDSWNGVDWSYGKVLMVKPVEVLVTQYAEDKDD